MAKWPCPGHNGIGCPRGNRVIGMFHWEDSCLVCGISKPVDQDRVILEAFVKAKPSQAYLLGKGKGKCKGTKGTDSKDKGKGKGKGKSNDAAQTPNKG